MPIAVFLIVSFYYGLALFTNNTLFHILSLPSCNSKNKIQSPTQILIQKLSKKPRLIREYIRYLISGKLMTFLLKRKTAHAVHFSVWRKINSIVFSQWQKRFSFVSQKKSQLMSYNEKNLFPRTLCESLFNLLILIMVNIVN